MPTKEQRKNNWDYERHRLGRVAKPGSLAGAFFPTINENGKSGIFFQLPTKIRGGIPGLPSGYRPKSLFKAKAWPTGTNEKALAYLPIHL